MLQFITEDQQARKKVFFKPELSSEIKFTHMISPQFVNDTTLLYMSAYDFISYDTEEESFNLIHRPLPPENQPKNSTEEFINVNFGQENRQKMNQIFYLTKTVTPQEECYFLGRRVNAVNQDHERRMIATNRKMRKKKYTMSDIDNRGNVKLKVGKREDEQVPSQILEFKKEFIVKQNISLLIFVVKKQLKQPQIKLSAKKIPEQEQSIQNPDQQGQQTSQIHFQPLRSHPSNPSPPSSQKFIPEQPLAKQQKQYKNHLLIHSFKHNQTMTFQLDESIESAFQVTDGSPNIVCTTQKYVYLLNFELKNSYAKVEGSTSNFDLGNSDTYQSSNRGFLNSEIKVEILDKFQLKFEIKTEGQLPRDLCKPKAGHRGNQSVNMQKKKGKRHQSISHNSIVKDKRVSSLIKQKPGKEAKQPAKKDKGASFTNQPSSSKPAKRNSRFAELSSFNPAQQFCQEQPYQEMKTIKKAFKVLPISFYQQEFVMIVYVKSKVLCTPDSLETLSFSYETTFLAISEIDFTQITVNEVFTNANSNPILENGIPSNLTLMHRPDDSANDFYHIFDTVNELGDVAVNKGVILIWEKTEPIVHEIAFKVDYRTSQMLDLSQPKNLKTQKSLTSSVHYSLEYRNKITLHLNSNLIREIVISPHSQNFLIITGKNYANNNNSFRDSELDYADSKPEDLDEKYDVANYLMFQYDLFNELWSSDANVYLKSIPLSYQKRRVDQIVPFRMKNQVLALTGKKVHQMHKSLLDGILCFDLHPYGYYIAVSFGFNAKIYSLEHSRLNLIYTYNSQNIKKLKYSPNGSELIIMSQKNIKVIDAYSFSIKYILQEKSGQCSYTNFTYSFSGMEFFAIYDNVFVNVYDGFSYVKTGSVKPGQSLLGFQDRISMVVADSEQKFVMALLENGKLYFKWSEDVIAIQHQRMFAYEDEKVIKTIHYDPSRGVLFCGLSTGVVRSHVWPIKNEASYNFNTFSQFKFSYHPITCMNTSFLTNTVYIGDDNGNLTSAKYVVEREKKITGELRPNNYYIFATHSPMLNMPRTELQALEKCYKYVLSSNSTSIVQNPEKLKLEYKLNQIISRMNQQMKRFKKNMRDKLTQKQTLAKSKINFGKLYNQTKDKLCQVNHQIKHLKDQEHQLKAKLNQDYELDLKKIIETQNQLVKEKGLQLSKNFMAKAMLKQMQLNSYNQLKQKYQQVEYQYSPQGAEGFNLMVREEELVPFDEVDYLPNEGIYAKKQLIQKLDQDLAREQQRNYELKQKCTYMQNSKNNLQTGQIKQQTVIFRISLELQQMQTKLQYQHTVNQTLTQQLNQAQTKINHIQQKVIQRNPQFTKVVTGGSEGDDACNYKIWVKDKMSQEVDLLYNHYVTLGEIVEQKQLDIIEMVAYRKKCNDALESGNNKRSKLKQYLHYLKDCIASVKNKTNQIKYNCHKYDFIQDKVKCFTSKKDLILKAKLQHQCFTQTKALNFAIMQLANKKIIQNQKLKLKQKQKQQQKLTNLKAQLQSTPGPEPQDIIIQQTQQAHKMLLRRCSNIHALPKSATPQQLQKFIQSKNTPKKSISPEMRLKMDKIVLEIDQKVKNQWANLETQKLNLATATATPFRSSSNNCLSRRLRKLKSQARPSAQMTFAEKLVEKMKEKDEKEKENHFFHEDSLNSSKIKRIDKIVPFSATSSPVAKQIASHFNLYEKSSKFLKNNVKIQQRKVKRLNGQKAELLSEYQQLRYENKVLEDDQAMVKEGIEAFNEMFLKETKTGEYFFNDKETGAKPAIMTPFQKFIEQKSNKMSPNKTSTNFRDLKENFMIKRGRRGESSRNSGVRLNTTSTGFNSPQFQHSPRKLTERVFRKY